MDDRPYLVIDISNFWYKKTGPPNGEAGGFVLTAED